jgi:hypothetical protein
MERELCQEVHCVMKSKWYNIRTRGRAERIRIERYCPLNRVCEFDQYFVTDLYIPQVNRKNKSWESVETS